MKNRIKKIISIILLVLWMIVVFLLSNENASISSNTSSNFIKSFLKIVRVESDVQLVSSLQFIFRKLAHLTLYFIGGFLSYNVFKEYFKKSKYISFLFIVIYAILDEIHQSFIPGRSMQFTDVLIDSIGGIIGIFICYIINKLIYKLLKRSPN